MNMILNITFCHAFGDVTYCADLKYKDPVWIENEPHGLFDISDFDVVDACFNKVVKKVFKKLKKVEWREAAWNLCINDSIPILDMAIENIRIISYITIDLDSFDKEKFKYDN